jgi:hypothetical protein
LLPSGQKLTFGLLATITLEVVTFHAYAPFPVLLPCLNATWKSCSVRVFSTACDFASITSVKMAAFLFYFQLGTQREMTVRLFLAKHFLMKKEV